MEPVTHFLTGACIGRAGLNRRTAYATLAATLAAEAPDLDVLWSLGGPVVGFAHHRGITHTLIGAPFVAIIITGFVWLLDQLWLGRRKTKFEPQPVRWTWVFLAAFLADLSHLVLDWTNNYGIRPFYPFNGRWYSGDLVFIAEPVIWGMLLIALILPALLGLADREMGARRMQFRGRGWAIAALTGMVVLWCWRWAEHAQAHTIVDAAQVTPTPATRIALEPYPINPYRWHAVLETDSNWQVAEVDTRSHSVQSDIRTDSLFKPATTSAIDAARHSQLAQVYLDWSQWPVIRDLGTESTPGHAVPKLPPSQTYSTIEFSDLRFAYAYLDTGMNGARDQTLEHMLANSGLTGWVYVLNGKEVAAEFLSGREQK